MKEVTILTGDPIVIPLAESRLIDGGLAQIMEWVQERRPECLPEEWMDRRIDPPAQEHPLVKALRERAQAPIYALFPHGMKHDDGTDLTDAELLAEIAGRSCYQSWGAKAGKKSNREYLEHTQSGPIAHASIMYHPKMTFFIAGVSRRVSHELIRNYVGADRSEEGSPSQESTRYVEHAGFYVAHPWMLDDEYELTAFRQAMQQNYELYLSYIERQHAYEKIYEGLDRDMRTMRRKRIYESASAYLSHACETSWVWTTNPIALAKLFRERGDQAADLEFQRLARKWAKLCVKRWPNLFPQPWVKELAAR